jgi:hypothetical protein
MYLSPIKILHCKLQCECYITHATTLVKAQLKEINMAGFNMLDEVLASQWMAKEDVTFEGTELTIAGVSKEEIGQDRDVKFALHFKFGAKPLILNKTNTRILAALFGPQSDGWTNQRIVAYNDPSVGYAGQLTGGVRLRAVSAAKPASVSSLTPEQLKEAAAAYARATGAGPVAEIESDIPF